MDERPKMSGEAGAAPSVNDQDLASDGAVTASQVLPPVEGKSAEVNGTPLLLLLGAMFLVDILAVFIDRHPTGRVLFGCCALGLGIYFATLLARAIRSKGAGTVGIANGSRSEDEQLDPQASLPVSPSPAE